MFVASTLVSLLKREENGALISLQLAYIICKIWKSEKNTPFTLTELTVCTVDSLLCYLHCMSERKEKMQLYQYLHARSQRCCHCCVKHYIPPSPHFWCVFYANEKPHFLLVASYANCECEMFWLWGEKSSFFPPKKKKENKTKLKLKNGSSLNRPHSEFVQKLSLTQRCSC